MIIRGIRSTFSIGLHLYTVVNSNEKNLGWNKINIHNFETQTYVFIIFGRIKWAKLQNSNMMFLPNFTFMAVIHSLMPKVFDNFEINGMDKLVFLSILSVFPKFHIYYRHYQTVIEPMVGYFISWRMPSGPTALGTGHPLGIHQETNHPIMGSIAQFKWYLWNNDYQASTLTIYPPRVANPFGWSGGLSLRLD